MMTMRRILAALASVALAGAPLAAAAKQHVAHHAQVTHHVHGGARVSIPATRSGGYVRSGSSGLAATSAAQPRTYGSSGNPVGTVPAPSIGSYYWPQVGVTNAVPTWNNTNPPGRR